ncbi:MAG: sigma-54 dependent transcriptional regulator [Deltaproteobacteria bacterium]|nr:sigma-54 dependent transcriptional regulator [Deltaproteobacteria bacterium]NND30632.1 sigma-54-dependent Fis family transcriptional regulator [Myxococcales bacterium]MBT8465739.1 sigma-54 dependent transcriptional regulator [Deltaproteobacteria bacterium]MBT8482690.1 sigma-54 dependent transcriptional regulator [Deltaproteobacteria bacterium]NNK08275.1 sigma-54-dependent Fis family transcriptional regulator [Myxococcales bacterium]
MRRVLVVDDEENIRLVLRTLLKKHEYQVETAESAEMALEQLERFDPDFVLADVRMSGMTGIELCTELKARSSLATVILMSAYGSVDLAIEAMKAGAYDYIAKPFKQDEVLLALTKAQERESLRRENRALKEAMRREQTVHGILGKSEAIGKVFATIGKVADYKTTVLIQGESGTGKELVARALRDSSARKNKPFIPINCGAIPETLLESELFGHRKGAFTDAHADKKGLFAEAHQGTLFLDEIGELPLSLQVKLLRVLQEGCVRPLGATRDQDVDVRVIAATVRDLRREVEEGRFREDLYYRLNVLQINVPPLRERRDDILLLVEHFIERNNRRLGTQIRDLDPRTRKLLLEYPWPGNVRELENTIERAVVLADGDMLTVADLPERMREPTDPVASSLANGELSIKKTARFMEETLIRRALEKTGGNRTAAAKLLEISHRALLYKIKDYGIQ